ncbi:MAG: hypothetical protein GY862_10700 [Gammaproteobacteria bacterium]|nr:hypothetical protein [Gammaproteobacteria bacterium]
MNYFQAHPTQNDYLETLRSIWSDINLEQYTQRVSEHYAVLDLSGLASLGRNTPVLLKEVFVEPFVAWGKPEAVLKALSKKNRKRVIVLGNSGSGKSTLARYLLLSVLNPPCDATGQMPVWLETFRGHLPVLVELRRYDMSHHMDFLESCYGFQHCPQTHSGLREQLKTRPSLVIFDGLNEISDPGERQKATLAIIRFARKHTNARVVVTSLFAGYYQSQSDAFQTTDFQEYALQDLQPEQIKTFAQSWFKTVSQPDEAAFRSQRIAEALQHAAAIRLLAASPLACTIMASVARHQELPDSRAKLYKHAVKALCHHWEVARSREIPDDLMREEDKLALLRRIAWRMQSARQGLKGNVILKTDLQNEIEDYIQTRRPDLPAKKVTTIAHAMIHPLSGRRLILCQYDDQRYEFMHRAFLEYFCAAEIVERLRPHAKEKLTPEKLKTDIFLAHYQDKTWHEVLRLICGMVEPLLAGELINAIAPARQKAFARTKDLILTVQCLAEAAELDPIAKVARRVLENLCAWFEQTQKRYSDDTWRKEMDFYQNAIPALEKIGKNWPGREDFLAWLSKPHKIKTTGDGWHAFGRMAAALWSDYDKAKEMLMTLSRETTKRVLLSMVFDALARGFGKQPEIQVFLQQAIMSDQCEKRRCAAIDSLAMHYADAPDTLPKLMEIVTSDPDDPVCYHLLYVLADHCTDMPDLLPLFRQFATNNEEHDEFFNNRQAALDILAEHYADVPDTLSLLIQTAADRQENGRVRAAAASALAEHCADVPETLPLLRQIIADEPDEIVCSDLVCYLAHYCTDAPETLPCLIQFATHDQKRDVRIEAINALATYYADVPDILPLLTDFAADAQETQIRSTAIDVLAAHYTDTPGILPQLMQFAKSDRETEIRGTAISALARCYTPSILPLLWQFATNDRESEVRCEAIGALAQHYTNAPENLPRLLQLAADDQETDVRHATLWALAAHYRDKPETLSLLKKFAADDQESELHHAAVVILAESYVLETLPLLRQFAANELEDSDLRCTVIWALRQYYANAPETLSLLKQLATNDQESGVRDTANEVLAYLHQHT